MRMLTLMIFMVLSWSPIVIQAHAVITRTSLDSQPVQPHQATEIQLFFNSNIEPALSIIELVSEGDRKQPVPLRRGDHQGEVIVELPPLPPGEYALHYRVFAADGHLTEDILKFFIKEGE